MKLISKYFDNLSGNQLDKYARLQELYKEWNSQINVISRKDIDDLYERHVLHSLGIAKVMEFNSGSEILDIGTGGGFPGIPLAIMFPETKFHLVDSIGKKIKVVKEVSASLGLDNVVAEHSRAEKIKKEYDFIVSRAVTRMENFVPWTRNKIKKKGNNKRKNGILYLKGGDLAEELAIFKKFEVFNLKDYFEEEFFESKKVVYMPCPFLKK